MPKKITTRLTKSATGKRGNIRLDFITLTSHQLRTPLSGMKWLLELLKKDRSKNLTKQQKEYLEKIYNTNERMIALVNDLLEVVQLNSGGDHIYLQPTDLVNVINTVIREREREIKQKHLKFRFTIEHEPFPYVKTETIKIKQALNNLIQNAINYTPDAGEISIDLMVNDAKMALVAIRDSGVGIPKHQQKNVFSKFFRAENILQFETVGTGLGLYISKSFIEASGGKIWFKSSEDTGTTFYFTLPITKL